MSDASGNATWSPITVATVTATGIIAQPGS